MRAISRIFNDIKSGRHLETYAITLVGLVVAVLNIFGSTNQSIVNAAVISILALLLYGRVSDKHEEEKNTFALQEFHPSRLTVTPLHETLAEASEEALLIGIALSSIAHSQRGLMEKLARNGCKVKLAIWFPPLDHPNRNCLFQTIDATIDISVSKSLINSNCERLKYWYSTLEDDVRRNIELRSYSEFPTASVIFTDKDKPHGKVHFEPLIYKMRPDDLPSFRLGPYDSPVLFQNLRNQYTKLWDKSQSLV
jgi:hypothetical protein